jgi:hypothetical protein
VGDIRAIGDEFEVCADRRAEGMRMREMDEFNGRGICEDRLRQISKAVHDLCQPLTTLQCRLEIAGLTGTAEAYREGVDLGLVECARIVEAVGTIRGIVHGSAYSTEAVRGLRLVVRG